MISRRGLEILDPASGVVPPAARSLTVSGKCGLFLRREVHGDWELSPAMDLGWQRRGKGSQGTAPSKSLYVIIV